MNPATESAAVAINSLGVDLLARATKPNENCVLSPYSIQYALVMAYAGADGQTRAEMAKVLHYVLDEPELHRWFAALQQTLDELAKESAERVENRKRPPPFEPRPPDPVTLTVAHSLFSQQGYEFLAPFLALVKDNCGASFQTLDFAHDKAGARRQIEVRVDHPFLFAIQHCPSGACLFLGRVTAPR